MITLEVVKYNSILIEKMQKYQPYHQVKLIDITEKDILPSNQKQLKIKKNKLTSSLLGKAFEKQTKTIKSNGSEQVDNLESSQFSEKQLLLMKDVISN